VSACILQGMMSHLTGHWDISLLWPAAGHDVPPEQQQQQQQQQQQADCAQQQPQPLSRVTYHFDMWPKGAQLPARVAGT
jgi:hypothetical protein